MRPLTEFATESYPLHPSQLRLLMICPWRVAVEFLSAPDDEHGVAGDTGSAMHVAVANFHRGKQKAECIAAMGSLISRYPKADLADAANMFLKYSGDIRNKEAECVAVEYPINFQIQAAEEDKTQTPIEIIGTVDQVRREFGKLKLYDLKTSKKDAQELLYEYTFQIAAYCIGASIGLGEIVHPGGIILARK